MGPGGQSELACCSLCSSLLSPLLPLPLLLLLWLWRIWSAGTAANSNPPRWSQLFMARVLLCLVIAVHKWQNWTCFQRSKRKGSPHQAAAARRLAAPCLASTAQPRSREICFLNMWTRPGTLLCSDFSVERRHVKPRSKKQGGGRKTGIKRHH